MVLARLPARHDAREKWTNDERRHPDFHKLRDPTFSRGLRNVTPKSQKLGIYRARRLDGLEQRLRWTGRIFVRQSMDFKRGRVAWRLPR
jgi:hypothetical protein